MPPLLGVAPVIPVGGGDFFRFPVSLRGADLGLSSNIRTTELYRTVRSLKKILKPKKEEDLTNTSAGKDAVQ